MKEWFKYEFGFVNIDSDNLYLTNTGNWSETAQLSEKSKEGLSKKFLRRIRIQIYFILTIIVFSIILLRMFSNGNIYIIPIGLLALGSYYLYHYLRTEMGPKFLIPLNKIKEFEIEDNQVKIYFLDQKNEEDFVVLKKVELKGLNIIAKLTYGANK